MQELRNTEQSEETASSTRESQLIKEDNHVSDDGKKDSPERLRHGGNKSPPSVVTLEQWRIEKYGEIKGCVYDHPCKENGTYVSITPTHPIVGKIVSRNHHDQRQRQEFL